MLPTVGCHPLPLLPPPLPYPQEEEVDGLQRALDQAQRSLDAGRQREEEARQAGREGAERARRAEAMAQEHDAEAQQVRGDKRGGGGLGIKCELVWSHHPSHMVTLLHCK